MASPYSRGYTPPTPEDLKRREAEKSRIATEYEAGRLALPDEDNAEYPAALRRFLASDIANTAKAQGAGYRAYESVMALEVVAKRHRSAVSRDQDADVWSSITAGTLDGKSVLWAGYDRTPKNRFVVIAAGIIPAVSDRKIVGVVLSRRTFTVGNVHYSVWTATAGAGTLYLDEDAPGDRIGTRSAISRVTINGKMQPRCISHKAV